MAWSGVAELNSVMLMSHADLYARVAMMPGRISFQSLRQRESSLPMPSSQRPKQNCRRHNVSTKEAKKQLPTSRSMKWWREGSRSLDPMYFSHPVNTNSSCAQRHKESVGQRSACPARRLGRKSYFGTLETMGGQSMDHTEKERCGSARSPAAQRM